MAAAENTHTQVGHEGGAHQKAKFPPLDTTSFSPQLIWLGLCLLFFYFFLSRFALPRIGSVIEQRRERITRDIDEAERLKDETEKAMAAYEQSLSEARSKAHDISHETQKQLQAEIDQEKADLERKIAERVTLAEKRISDSKQSALSHINEIATDTTEALLDKLAGMKLSEHDIGQVVTASLKVNQK